MRNPWRLREGSQRLVSSPFALPQRISRRALHRVPRRPLPRRAGRACGRVLHPARVERRPPPLLVIASELEVDALARHADGDVPDAAPRIEPTMKGLEDGRVLTLKAKEDERGEHQRASALSHKGSPGDSCDAPRLRVTGDTDPRLAVWYKNGMRFTCI